MRLLDMDRKVLDVGQCTPDHMAIRRLVESLGAEVERVALPTEALARLRQESYALVLVNRKIDQDYTDGIALVEAMQADGELKEVPVMLISNYPEAQQEAIAAGAVQGFGKMAIGDPATRHLLERFLKPARAGSS